MPHIPVTKVPVESLLLLALESPLSGWDQEMGDKAIVAKDCRDLLIEKSPMLDDYFGIGIDKDGCLTHLPAVVEGHVPPVALLPLFLLKLSVEVDWEAEEPCFRDIAEKLSYLYSIHPLVHGNSENDIKTTQYMIQHVLMASVKRFFEPPNICGGDGSIIQIGNLENLYKIFERC